MHQLQRAEGGRRVDGVDRRHVRRRKAQQAGQGRRGAGGEDALIVLERDGLGSIFMEIADPGEGGQALAAFIVDAEFLAVLVAARILRKDEERQGEAVRIEHFQGLEAPERADRGQPQRVADPVVHQTGDAPGGPLQAEVATARKAVAAREGRAGVPAQVAQHPACQGVGGKIGQRLEGRPRRIVLFVVEDQVGLEPVARAPLHNGAIGGRIGGVEVAAAQQIVDKAVARLDAARKADGEGGAQGHVHHRLEAAIVEVSDLELRRRGEAAGVRLVLDDVDGADQGAAPEQGRLRPLGDFDPGVVEQLDVRAARLGDGHPVLEDRHARLDRGAAVIRGDAAHDKAGIVGRLVLDLEARDEKGEFLELLHADIVQEVAGIGGQGDRHLEGALLALLGRDDQFLNGGGARAARRIALSQSLGAAKQG